jgi:hypothetical protein
MSCRDCERVTELDIDYGGHCWVKQDGYSCWKNECPYKVEPKEKAPSESQERCMWCIIHGNRSEYGYDVLGLCAESNSWNLPCRQHSFDQAYKRRQ